jgi:hypothetical protein
MMPRMADDPRSNSARGSARGKAPAPAPADDDEKARAAAEPVAPTATPDAGNGNDRDRERDDISDDRDEGRKKRDAAADVIRRLFYTGVGALFATEEGLRKVAGELPKEAAGYLVGQAHTAKDEVMRVVSQEVRRFLEGVNVEEVIRKVLSTVALEVKMEVRFLPNRSDLKTEIKKVTVKRVDDRENDAK